MTAIIYLFTATGLLPGGSGYFTCKQNMKLGKQNMKLGKQIMKLGKQNMKFGKQNMKLVNKT